MSPNRLSNVGILDVSKRILGMLSEHVHKATALGFEAFCANYFSEYDKHEGPQQFQFMRLNFQKKHVFHFIEHISHPGKLITK